MKYIPLLILAFVFSCKKETPPTARASAAVTDLQTFLPGTAWRLAEYYTTSPVDYDKDDTVAASTDHRKYVPYNIFFDSTVIHESTVTVYQGIYQDQNLPGTFDRPFGLSASGDDVHVQFLAFDHSPLSYTFVERTDSTLIMSAMRGQDVVFSRFKRLK